MAQVGWLGSVAATPSDRLVADPLLSDFHYFSATNQTQTLQVKNLPAGRYDLTLYGYDPQYKDKQTQFVVDGNNDGLADITVSIINKAPSSEIGKTVAVNVSDAGILNVTVSMIAIGGAINGFDLVPGPPDTTPPAAVANLAVAGTTTTQAMLTWTAPADDNGTAGRVSRLRYPLLHSHDYRCQLGIGNPGNRSARSRQSRPAAGSYGQWPVPQHHLLLRDPIR